MDLIGVNNSIVNMRKTAIKAKIHVIRQLVKQMKVLKNKKVSKDEHKAQNERKLSRFQSEMNIIKHLKKDDITRFALLNKQNFLPDINPEKDANRLEELLKKRALVRLSNSTVMKKDVATFRKNYPDWESQLSKIFKVLGKKQQKKNEMHKKKKREEERAAKKSKKTESNDVDKVEENNATLDELENSDAEDEESDDMNENKSDVDEEEHEEEQVQSKKEGELEVKQLDLNELIEEDSESEPEKSDNFFKSNEKQGKKDSFFIGGQSSNDESSDEGDTGDQIESSINDKVSQKRNDFFGRNHQDFKSKRGNADGNRFGTRGRGRGRGFDSNNRGRGRNFEDRSNFSNSRGRGRGFEPRGNFSNSRGRGRGFEKRNDFQNDSNLHPSWSAKRNQPKFLIDAPQNKKIKFGGDERVSNVAKNEDHQPSNLHPSWAAKKNKKSIQPFQGKKMVFDD